MTPPSQPADAHPLIIDVYLQTLLQQASSDLILTAGAPPTMRKDGALVPIAVDGLRPDQIEQMAREILSPERWTHFQAHGDLDFSFNWKGQARFRINIFKQRGSVGLALRLIPYQIPNFDQLGVPMVVRGLTRLGQGLILVTGPTGSGKSTTLAAMLDKVNRERHEHIVTVEDPVEYLHSHKSCIVNQREIHSDTHNFANALRSALRQDPDVVLIGEMRDLETVESALRIAETGHLTFATLHTNSAAQSINRIIDVFPAHQQGQIRAQLSLVLEGILCQALLPRAGGKGRALAMEILVPNAAIRNLIREDKVHQIYGMMQAGQAKHGMQTFNQSLAALYFRRMITMETAMSRSSLPEELQEIISRGPASLNPSMQA
jgi:twitching motility protein PilT